MPTSRSVRRWVPLALVAGIALSACGTKVAGGGAGGSTDLSVLHIGQRPGAPAAAGASRDADPYPLTGTLPTAPSTAPVYRYDDARTDEAVVTTLAAAFHVSGTPVRHAHGWVITAKDASVAVTDGDAAWSYSIALNGCLGMPVDVDNLPGTSSAVGCAVASPPPLPAPDASGSPQPAPPSAPAPADLSDADALAVAGPVLTALGADPSDARVAAGSGSVRWITWDPAFDAMPSTGASTTLTVDATGVVSAQGVRAEPTLGPTYPLISAAAALDLLRAQPVPEIAIACAIGQTCPGVGPHKVTGGRLGLMSAYDDATRVLVPAWFFTVAGSDQPVPVVAVEAAYIADPTGSRSSGGASAEPGSSGGGAGSDPGSSFVPIPPGTPQPEPATGTAHELPVQSVTLGKDGRTMVLHSFGGMCEDFTASSVENASEIRVTLTSTWNKGSGVACPAMAKEISVPLTLAAPWDNRRIVDTSTDQPVPVG
jgi:hypothetical protein